MSAHPNLQILIGAANLDQSFRERLLNGDRLQVIDTLDLSEAEREAVLAIKAETLTDFAQALLDWMRRQNGLASKNWNLIASGRDQATSPAVKI